MAPNRGVNGSGESAVGGVGGEEVRQWANGRTPQAVTNYRYNGPGMRIMWQSDLDAGGTLEDSERTYAAYDSRWRIVATFADQAAAPAEAFVHHAAGLGAGGGSSYIDSVILRDRDADTDESHTLEERRYFCQNWRADVVAVTKSDGTPVEYVRYSAYGEPTVYPLADINMDGVVNAADYAIWVNIVAGGAAGAEVVGADLNFDGTADAAEGDGYDFYESYDANAGLSGTGHVSSPSVAGRLGYAGYEWDDVLKAAHVRHRVYFPDIGRWSKRDPVGYVDSNNVYAYVLNDPIAYADPLGLLHSSALPYLVQQVQPLPTPGTAPRFLPNPGTRFPGDPGTTFEFPTSPGPISPIFPAIGIGGGVLCVVVAGTGLCVGYAVGCAIWPDLPPVNLPPTVPQVPPQKPPAKEGVDWCDTPQAKNLWNAIGRWVQTYCHDGKCFEGMDQLACERKYIWTSCSLGRDSEEGFIKLCPQYANERRDTIGSDAARSIAKECGKICDTYLDRLRNKYGRKHPGEL